MTGASLLGNYTCRKVINIYYQEGGMHLHGLAIHSILTAWMTSKDHRII